MASSGIDFVRSQVPWMRDLSDEEVLTKTSQILGKSLPDTVTYLGYDVPKSMMGKEFAAGLESYKGGFGHIGAAMGIPGAAEYAKRKEERADVLQGLSTAPHSYKEVEWGHPEKGVLPYIGHLAATSAPYAAEAATYGIADVATGGALTPAILARYAARAGTALPKFLGGQGLKAGATAAERAAAEVAAREAAPSLARTAMLPAVTYPSSLGDTLGNQFAETGQYNLPTAAAAAVPYSALNILGLEGAITRGALPRLGLGSLERNLAGRVASGTLATGAQESFAETGQEVFNQAARMGVNPNASLFDPEAIERYKESAIAGGILGGLPGAVGGIPSRKPLDKRVPADLTRRLPDETYEQQLERSMGMAPGALGLRTPEQHTQFTQQQAERDLMAGLYPPTAPAAPVYSNDAVGEMERANGVPPGTFSAVAPAAAAVPPGGPKPKATANAARDATAVTGLDPVADQIRDTKLQLHEFFKASHPAPDTLGRDWTPGEMHQRITQLVGNPQTIEEAAATLKGKIAATLLNKDGKATTGVDRRVRAEKMVQFYNQMLGIPEDQQMDLEGWERNLVAEQAAAAQATAAANAKIGQEGQVPGAVVNIDPATLNAPAAPAASAAVPTADTPLPPPNPLYPPVNMTPDTLPPGPTPAPGAKSAGIPAKPQSPEEVEPYRAAIIPHLLKGMVDKNGVENEDLMALRLVHGLQQQNAGDEEAVKSSLRAAAKQSGIPFTTLADRASRALAKIEANAAKPEIDLPVEAAQALLGMQTSLDVLDVATPSGAYEGTQAVNLAPSDDFQETAGYERAEATLQEDEEADAEAAEGEEADAAVEAKQRAEFENKWVDANGQPISHADVQRASEDYGNHELGYAAGDPTWDQLSPKFKLQWTRAFLTAHTKYKPKQVEERRKFTDTVRTRMAEEQEEEGQDEQQADDGAAEAGADDARGAQGVGREVGGDAGTATQGDQAGVPPARTQGAPSKEPEKPEVTGQGTAAPEVKTEPKKEAPKKTRKAAPKVPSTTPEEKEALETSGDRWNKAAAIVPRLGKWESQTAAVQREFAGYGLEHQNLNSALKLVNKPAEKEEPREEAALRTYGDEQSGGVFLQRKGAETPHATLTHKVLTEDSDLVLDNPELKGATLIQGLDAQEKGKGDGTRLLKHAIESADKEGRTLVVVPAASSGMSQEQLKAWYARNGFEDRADYMIRRPKSEATAPAPAVEAKKEEAPAAVPEITAEQLTAEVEKLPKAEQQTLADHYGTKVGSKRFLSKLAADVQKYVANGAEAVNSAIRNIIKKIAVAVLAAGVVFNPAVFSNQNQALAYDLPAAVTTSVTTPSVTTTKELRANVPANAVAKMSKLAQRVYEAMAPLTALKAGAKIGKGFIIADKPNGMMHAFHADGTLMAQSPALYGKDVGDAEVGNSLKGGRKITPAGTFTLVEVDNAEYAGGKVLGLRETQAGGGFIAVHAVYLGEPKEQRQQRLNSESPTDNRISYGCINTTNEAFLNDLLPNSAELDGGPIFVLPDEVAKTEAMFPAKTETTTTPGVTTTHTATPGNVTADNERGENLPGNRERERTLKRAASSAKRRESLTDWAKRKWGERAAPNGKKIVDNFLSWFGNSVAVNTNGDPALIFHGTVADFAEFKKGWNAKIATALGFHFAADSAVANNITTGTTDRGWGRETKAGANVLPVYLRIENPLVITGEGQDDSEVARAVLRHSLTPEYLHQMLRTNGFGYNLEAAVAIMKRWADGKTVHIGGRDYTKNGFIENYANAALASYGEDQYGRSTAAKTIQGVVDKFVSESGYDGIVYENTSPMETKGAASKQTFIAFHPEQVKSAVGNNGNFSDVEADIRLSQRASTGTVKSHTTVEHTREKLKKLFFSGRRFDRRVTVVQSIDDLPWNMREWARKHGRVQAFVTMQNGQVYMIADNIAKGRELAVFLHEIGVHTGMERLIGMNAMWELAEEIHTWAALEDGSLKSLIAKDALKRVEFARETAENNDESFDRWAQIHETIAYFVEEAVDAGIDPTQMAGNKTELGRWFRKFWKQVSETLRRLGWVDKPNELSASDVVALAYGAAQLDLKNLEERPGFGEKPTFDPSTNRLRFSERAPDTGKSNANALLDSGDYVFHAVRNDEDIAGIFKSGLKHNSNVSLDRNGQAFEDEGGTVLVFRKEDVGPQSKGYQNDGVVTKGGAKPVAIIKDTSVDVRGAVTDEGLDVESDRLAAAIEANNKLADGLWRGAGLDVEGQDNAHDLSMAFYRVSLKRGEERVAADRALQKRLGDFYDRAKEVVKESDRLDKQLDRLNDKLERGATAAVTPGSVLARYKQHGVPVHALPATGGFQRSQVSGTRKTPTTVAHTRTKLKKLFYSDAQFDKKVTIVQHPSELAGIVPANMDLADTRGLHRRSDGHVILIADNIDKGDELSVFMHEVGVHAGLNKLIGRANTKKLAAQVWEWADRNDGSQKSYLAKRAMWHVDGALANYEEEGYEVDEENRIQETVAYFVNEAIETAGINPSALPRGMETALADWLTVLWENLKIGLRKMGLGRFDSLSSQDIVDLVYGAARIKLEGTPRGLKPEIKKALKPGVQRSERAEDADESSKSPTTAAHTVSTLKKLFFSNSRFDQKVTVVQSVSDLDPAFVKKHQIGSNDQGYTDPDTGHVTLIADNIDKGSELGIFLHEMGVHVGMEKLIGEENMVGLAKKINDWVDRNDGSIESFLAKRVIARVMNTAANSEKRGEEFNLNDYMQETIAYMVEEAVAHGINPTAMDSKTELGRWFRKLWDAVKVALRKLGLDRFDTITAQDVVNLAYGAARMELEGKGNRAATQVGADKGKLRFSQRSTLPAVKATASKELTRIATFAQRHGLAVMITEDIADLAKHHDFREVRDYVNITKQREASRVEFELPVGKVTELYDLLPERERGTGPDSVNKFIHDATLRGDTNGINRLSAAGQDLVKAVFKHGKDTLELKKKLIEQDIGAEYNRRIAEETTDAAKDELRKERDLLLKKFSKLMTVEGSDTYAPLKRFGDYVVSAKSKEYLEAEENNDQKWINENQTNPAHVQVHFADSQGEADALEAEIKQDINFKGGKTYAAAREADIHNHRDLFRAFPVLQTKLAAEFPTEGKSPMARIIRDLYLQALAENTARKNELRRRGITGASTDMMRAFVTQGRADAAFLSNLKHNDAVQKAVQAMRDGADRDRRTLTPYLNEMLKRHAASYETHSNRTADKLKRAGSMWMLATNPTYYLQQLVQPWSMSLPVIAGKQGYFRTVRALRLGYSDVKGLVFNTGLVDSIDWSKAPADVRDMLAVVSRNGAIDITNAMDQGEWEMADKGRMGAGWNRVDRKLRGLNTRVEAMNRAVTAIAAYRMELSQNGGNKALATEYAEAMVRQTHGSYDGSNTPRYMQSPVMQVVTQFRRFQIIQLSMIARLFHNAFKGTNAEEKAVARRALTYTLLHTAGLGGALGMPGATMVAGLVAKLFGPDDEPEDFEKVARELIGDQIISDLLLKGVPAMLGVDLSSKLGMGNLLTFAPFAEFPHDRPSYEKYVSAALGPVVGLGAKAVDGLNLIYKGDLSKGAELLLPNGFGNVMKAYRVATEGVSTRAGDTVLSSDELSVVDAFFQGVGAPTTTITHQQRLQRSKFAFDTYYKDRTSELIRDYQQARRDGEPVTDVMTEWREVQDARVRNGYARQPISTLIKSAQAQSKRERDTAGGVEFTKANKAFVQRQANL